MNSKVTSLLDSIAMSNVITLQAQVIITDIYVQRTYMGNLDTFR